MHELINYANAIVLYTVCYALFFTIYGFAIYHIVKFIIRILVCAYQTLKADWQSLKSNKEK